MTPAETARHGLVLIDLGVKKLRDAGVGNLADEIDAVVAQAVSEAEDAMQAGREAKAIPSLHAGPACGEP